MNLNFNLSPPQLPSTSQNSPIRTDCCIFANFAWSNFGGSPAMIAAFRYPCLARDSDSEKEIVDAGGRLGVS